MTSELRSVITGASSGIGRAIAIAIASNGGSVCLVGRDQERLEAVAKISRETARSVLVHTADLSVDGAVEALAQRIAQEFRALDILVHCAGAHRPAHSKKPRFNSWIFFTEQISACRLL